MSTTETVTAPSATNCPRVMIGAGIEVHLRSNCYTDVVFCNSLRRGSWLVEVPMSTEVTCAKCAKVLARFVARDAQ